MELRVIGCDGTYPSANGACSGYLVKAGGTRVLLDCGSGVLSKLMALMDPADLDALVLTHWHNDHASDLLVLRYYLQLQRCKLQVYAPVEKHPLMALCEGSEYVLHDIREVQEIGALRVSVQRTGHPVPCYAVRLEHQGASLVYTGDTNRWEPLIAFCQDADALICDATFYQDVWNENLPHLTAAQAAMLGREAKVGRVILTHFQPDSDAQSLLAEAKEVYKACEPALPGVWQKL